MPEETTTPHSHAKLFLWLGLSVLALVIISFVAVILRTSVGTGTPPVTSESIRLGEAPRPAFTEATKEKVRASSGFQALVSYTDTGFEPAMVAIAAGQVVRFTNNSSATIQLETNGVRISVAPQDFYEHTYVAAGEYAYQSASASGSVQVR